MLAFVEGCLLKPEVLSASVMGGCPRQVLPGTLTEYALYTKTYKRKPHISPFAFMHALLGKFYTVKETLHKQMSGVH